jgi:hypothetical protein
VLVLGGHYVGSRVPFLAGYSDAFAIAALIAATAIRAKPRNLLLDAPVIGDFPAPRSKSPPWRDGYILGTALMAILLIVCHWAVGASFVDTGKAIAVASLGIIAALSARVVGVLSVAWFAVPTASIYFLTYLARDVRAAPALLIVTVVVICIAWVGYLFILRVLAPSQGMLIDLGFVILLHRVYESSSRLAGDSTSRTLALSLPPGDWRRALILLTMCLFVMSFCVAGAKFHVNPRVRALRLGLFNFKLAHYHGFFIRRVFAGIAVILVFFAGSIAAGYAIIRGFVTTHELSVGLGLTVLLLSRFVRRESIAWMFLVVTLIYVFLETYVGQFGWVIVFVVGTVITLLPLYRFSGTQGQHGS